MNKRKIDEQLQAVRLRRCGRSVSEIATILNVSKSSVSVWVRQTRLSITQKRNLNSKGHTKEAVEKRRQSRLANEKSKRQAKILTAEKEVTQISAHELWLIGVMLYWAEGGKTQRMVRFSNGDPEMIKIMMEFFRRICSVPESKFRGHIHIHSRYDPKQAVRYWSKVSHIPCEQFFKTYVKEQRDIKPRRETLPNGVFDIYVMDVNLFLKIKGWSQGIFKSY